MYIFPVSCSVSQSPESFTVLLEFFCSWCWLFCKRLMLFDEKLVSFLICSWLFDSWLFFKDGWWFLWCSVVFDELLSSVLVYVVQLVVFIKSEHDFGVNPFIVGFIVFLAPWIFTVVIVLVFFNGCNLPEFFVQREDLFYIFFRYVITFYDV